MMIRRKFVNLVAENYQSGMYSLHRLDVSKHLFYPSTAEADAAAAANSKDFNGGGRSQPIPRLQRLPPACMSFLSSPTSASDQSDLPVFALVSPRRSEGRVLCGNMLGHSVIYDADSHSILTMPALNAFPGSKPITISTGPSDAVEEDLYLMHRHLHVLRFGPKDREQFLLPALPNAWHWESLRSPPLEDRPLSHTVVDSGRTICLSYADGLGTHCFDTVEREWWCAGAWELPFRGGAEYDPDLDLWFGFSPRRPYHLCATSELIDVPELIAMQRPPVLQHVLPDLDVPKNWLPMRFELINLGGGRLCVAKVFEEVELDTGVESVESDDPDLIGDDFVVLTGVELVTKGSGGENKPELEGIRVHKSVRYNFGGDTIEWVL